MENLKQENINSTKSYLDDFAVIIRSQNRETLYAFLQENAVGKNVPEILSAVLDYMHSSDFDYTRYWAFVECLLSYNAQMFLSTLVKGTPDVALLPKCDEDTLNVIVEKAFITSNKVKYALKLVEPCKKEITYQMSEYIIRQCIQLDSPDLIVKVFVFLDVHPSIAINILKANITHTAALYALYKYPVFRTF